MRAIFSKMHKKEITFIYYIPDMTWKEKFQPDISGHSFAKVSLTVPKTSLHSWRLGECPTFSKSFHPTMPHYAKSTSSGGETKKVRD